MTSTPCACTSVIARRSGTVEHTDTPGIVYLEIDGLALPVLHAARCATATHPSWPAGWHEGTHRLVEWEPDLSSQTGASQAGILLGSNDGHPGLPVGREADRSHDDLLGARTTATSSSAAGDRRSACSSNGGASRGNLLSGEADGDDPDRQPDHDEKRSNPGYRAFFANGFNVTRVLVLFFWRGDAGVDGGAAGDPPRRAAARAPRRHLPVHARRACASSSAT